MNKLLDTSAMSLPDLAARGLTAHLQDAVLNQLMDEQLDHFAARLRPLLEKHVRSITLGHVTHVKDVIGLAHELVVKIDVDIQEVKA